MFADAQEALTYLLENEVRFLDLMYTNLFGGLHHVTLPISAVSERTFIDGVGVDGSSIPGFKKLESGDMCVVPDPTSMFIDPFCKHNTVVALCDIVEADTKAPVANSPRRIARAAEQLLTKLGIGTRSMWGPEFEFYLFDEVSYENSPSLSGFEIVSEEAEPSEGGVALRTHKGYHAAPPADRLYPVRADIVVQMEAAGIPVKYHHHEVGAAGQVEIEIQFADLVAAADAIVKGKMIIKRVAEQHGMVATFMPKPMVERAGSGMHFHQHLFDGDRPLFFHEGNYADLSDLAISYTAGLLQHGSALLALTNPSTNSYRRLVPGYEAPVKAFFSLANRSAAIRVPRYANAPHEKRVEFRPPDATANPYLAMAAMLMAGIDGIRRQLDPTVLGFGPFAANVESLPAEERDAIKDLPTSLDDALTGLEADHAFLLEGGVFSEELVDRWVSSLRGQIRSLSQRPHPYEFELFLDA